MILQKRNNLYDELCQTAASYFCMSVEECGPIGAELLLCLEAALNTLEKKHLEPSEPDFREALDNILRLSSRLHCPMLAEAAQDLKDSLEMPPHERLNVINDCLHTVQTGKSGTP